MECCRLPACDKRRVPKCYEHRGSGICGPFLSTAGRSTCAAGTIWFGGLCASHKPRRGASLALTQTASPPCTAPQSAPRRAAQRWMWHRDLQPCEHGHHPACRETELCSSAHPGTIWAAQTRGARACCRHHREPRSSGTEQLTQTGGNAFTAWGECARKTGKNRHSGCADSSSHARRKGEMMIQAEQQ